MRIVVTGGAGFIGSHVAEALLAEGHEVSVLDDLSSGRRENVPSGATFVEGDVRDEDTVERLFRERRPEVVCHQAAQTSVSVSTREPMRDAKVNILGSLRIIEACVRHGGGRAGAPRLVFASTGGAIYGEVPEGEQAAVGWREQPMSPYGVAKLAVEGYLRAAGSEHGLEHRILRYANVYGPRQDPHGEAGVVAIFLERLLSGRPLQVNAMQALGDGGCVRDYVFVGDVVAANLAAIRGELGETTINVGTGVPTSTLEVARLAGECLGVRAAMEDGARRPGDLARSVLEPGPTPPLPPPTTLEKGFAATAAWFRAQRA